MAEARHAALLAILKSAGTVEGPAPAPQHHECHYEQCTPLQHGDVYVCAVTGRVHVCHPDHRTCDGSIQRHDLKTKEQTETCRYSGFTWSAYAPEPFVEMYRAAKKETRSRKRAARHEVGGPGNGKLSLRGLRPVKYKRVTSVTFEGVRTDIGRLAHELDPCAAHGHDGDDGGGAGDGGLDPADGEGGGGGGGDMDDRRARLYADKLQTRVVMEHRALDQICAQVLARKPTPEAWCNAVCKAEEAKTLQKVANSVRAFVAATIRAGYLPCFTDIVALRVKRSNGVRERDRQRRALTEQDLALMEDVIRQRCNLLWPFVQRKRAACINARRVEAGKRGRTTDLHFSPHTLNYTFHVLTVMYRSMEGEWETAADGTRKCIMAPIPLLDLVLPPERRVNRVCTPTGQPVISRAFTKIQSLLKEWIAEAVKTGAVTSPLVTRCVDRLADFGHCSPPTAGEEATRRRAAAPRKRKRQRQRRGPSVPLYKQCAHGHVALIR